MSSAVKSRPCSLDTKSMLFSLLESGALALLIPQSTIAIISAGISLLGNVLKVVVPEDVQFPRNILHGVTSFFESVALSKLSEKASTYAAKSAFNSVKTLLVGAIVIYQATVLQSRIPENGKCSQKEPRDGYLSQKKTKKGEFLQEAVRITKVSGLAVLSGGIKASLSIAEDWFKTLIFSNTS